MHAPQHNSQGQTFAPPLEVVTMTTRARRFTPSPYPSRPEEVSAGDSPPIL
jgi:hypothetical protein